MPVTFYCFAFTVTETTDPPLVKPIPIITRLHPITPCRQVAVQVVGAAAVVVVAVEPALDVPPTDLLAVGHRQNLWHEVVRSTSS